MADFDRRTRTPAQTVPRNRKEIDEAKGVLADVAGLNQSVRDLAIQVAAVEIQNKQTLEATEQLANQIQMLQVTPEELEEQTQQILENQQDIQDSISRVVTDNEALTAAIQDVLTAQGFLRTQIQEVLTAQPEIIREIVVQEVQVQTTATQTNTIIQETVREIIAANADIQAAVDTAIDGVLDDTDDRIDNLVDAAVADAIAALPATDDPDLDEATIRTIAQNTVQTMVDSLESELNADRLALNNELRDDINQQNSDIRQTIRTTSNTLDDKIDQEVTAINNLIRVEVTQIDSAIAGLPSLDAVETLLTDINARLQAINANIRGVVRIQDTIPTGVPQGTLWYNTGAPVGQRSLWVRGPTWWGQV